MKAELVPENGDPPIPIRRDVTVVGRKSFCDVQIDDPSLSKRHCLIVKTDGLLVVRDLVSTNGTKVKGQRVRWAALLPEDRLTLGGYKVRVYLGPDDVPAPSERPRRGASVLAMPGSAPAAMPQSQAQPQPRPAVPAPASRPPAAGVAPAPPAPSPREIGFAVPSSMVMPAVKTEEGDVAILPGSDDGSDSGWRHLIKPGGRGGDENLIIELD